MNKDILDYVKVLTSRDTKSLTAKGLKASEETGELAKAILPYENASGSRHRFSTKEKILEEAVDSILVNLSIAYSMDFSDDDINEMMHKKAIYWDSLQNRENNKDQYPFELHVTVKEAASYEQFKLDCASIGVKPVVLDLHKNSTEVIKDVMTSSTMMGDNESVLTKLDLITTQLGGMGYIVVRKKAETVPWHPMAPAFEYVDEMPMGCYFEAHVGVVLKDKQNKFLCGEALYELKRQTHVDVSVRQSSNVFKKYDDYEINMITARSYSLGYDEFKKFVEGKLIVILKEWGFEVEKHVIEFAIYDNNIKHDAEWIG